MGKINPASDKLPMLRKNSVSKQLKLCMLLKCILAKEIVKMRPLFLQKIKGMPFSASLAFDMLLEQNIKGQMKTIILSARYNELAWVCTLSSGSYLIELCHVYFRACEYVDKYILILSITIRPTTQKPHMHCSIFFCIQPSVNRTMACTVQ